MFDNKSTRIKTQAPTPVDELFFCPVTVYSIDIWLRLSSYKQLVFHIYLHRFNILQIVTFNKLPCFVQPKSSNASVFFFLFETPVEINTWLLSFHQITNAPYVSFIITATNVTIIRKKFLASVMSSLSIELSAVMSVMSQRGIAPHCVLQLTPSVHFIEVKRMFSV